MQVKAIQNWTFIVLTQTLMSKRKYNLDLKLHMHKKKTNFFKLLTILVNGNLWNISVHNKIYFFFFLSSLEYFADDKNVFSLVS